MLKKNSGAIFENGPMSNWHNPNPPGSTRTDELKEKVRQSVRKLWEDPEYREMMRKARTNNPSVIATCKEASRVRQFSEESRIKERQTNEQNGRWLSLSEKTTFELYRRNVENYTRKNVDTTQLDGYEYQGKAGVDGAYHLDHRFSLLECFKQNIPVHIAGSECNLAFIPWEENQTKWAKCSITKEELNERFKKSR